jgi:hypothetical protein
MNNAAATGGTMSGPLDLATPRRRKNMLHDMNDHTSTQEERVPKKTGFWRSRAGFVTLAFLALGGLLLLSEHRAHALGFLPFLLLLACPLLHMFMHGGHGNHNHRDRN